MTRWFGQPWPDTGRRAPVCGDDGQQVPVPVGQPCSWCDEPMTEDSRGVLDVVVLEVGKTEIMPCHRECNLRRVLGGPGHLLGACLCNGADCDPDLGMSAREAAMLVWQIYHQLDDPQVTP